jgi:hypothetical protein
MATPGMPTTGGSATPRAPATTASRPLTKFVLRLPAPQPPATPAPRASAPSAQPRTPDRRAPWRRALALVAAGLVIVLPAVEGAADGEAARGFTFTPSLRTGAVYDDNVYFEPEDEVATGAGRAVPMLEAEYHHGRFHLGAEAGADLWWYPAIDGWSDVFFRGGGFAEIDLWRGLTLRLADLYAPQPVSLGRPEDDVGNLVQSNRAEAALRWRRELARETALEAAVIGTRFDGAPARGWIDQGTIAIDERFRTDFTEGAAMLELQRGFGRRTLAYLRAEGRERDYDELPQSDFGEAGGLVGVRFQGPARTQIEIAGGYGHVQYRHGGPSEPHARALVELTGEIGAGFSWRLGAQRRFTSDAVYSDYVENQFWVGLDKPIGERNHLSLAVTAGIADSDSRSITAPRWRGGEIALRRRLTRQMQGGLVFRRFVSDDSRTEREVTQHRVTLELEYRR